MANVRLSDCTSQRAPGRLMRQIDKLTRAMIEQRLAPLGLGYSQWATLKMLHEGVIATVGDVSRELGVTSGATTRMIDGLESRGLIERVRDRVDRRSIRLAETPAGIAAMAAGKPIVIDLWNELVADFSQAETDHFVDLLVKLLAAAERKAGDGWAAADAGLAEAVE